MIIIVNTELVYKSTRIIPYFNSSVLLGTKDIPYCIIPYFNSSVLLGTKDIPYLHFLDCTTNS